MRRKFLEGDIVIDTSILIEIALATEDGKKLVKLIVDEVLTPYTTSLNIIEALYVLCRLFGMSKAEKRIDLMVDSGYFNIVSSDRIGKSAAECKCLFRISIIDCHTLALAREYNMPVLFYRREKEFEPIVDDLKEWIRNRILFLVKDK